MSCYNNCYLPIPPRAWSRVQNSCSLTTNTENNGLVQVPYTNNLVPISLLGEKIAMLNKGNVLQYKANSSNLTQAQKYSKIAQGKWTNRNTTWATQSTRGYTNPNNTSLKRSGNVTNIAIDPITGAIIGPTTAPVTCPKPIVPINEGLPSNGGGGSTEEPEIPPPVEPTPASEAFPPIIPDTPIEPTVIQDEGVLICSVQENVCTGETKSSLSQQLCNPTSDSDVPGTIQLLCWNDGTPTWYPRSRYIMTNSANKWPTNATLFSAVRPSPPIITSITSNLNIVTLTWSQSEICLPVSFFNIFQDGIIIQIVPGTIFTTDIAVDNCNTYEYFIIAVTNGSNIPSDPSNTVSITISYIAPPTNLSYITIASGTIQLNWTPNCEAVSYNIYQAGGFIGNTSNTNFTVNNLINCNTYTFSVSSLDINGIESTLVTINDVQPLWPNPPTNLSGSVSSSLTQITLTWNIPNPNCSEPLTYNLWWSTDGTNFTLISIPYGATSYIFTAIKDTKYYFYMESVNGVGISDVTPTINITTSLYVITGDINYTETINLNLYTLTFFVKDDGNDGIFNILFNVNINNVTFTLVGGGGGGRGSGYYDYTGSEEWLVGGVGGGGAASIESFTNILSSSSFDLLVGKGGQGGLKGDIPPVPSGQAGNPTSVTTINVYSTFISLAPGGKTSTGFSNLSNVYYSNGVSNSDPPTSNGTSTIYNIGGGAPAGSGIYWNGSTASSYTLGGDGYNATGSLPYGGGGGTPKINANNQDTFTGAVVSTNNIGGYNGDQIGNQYQPSYLPGNQSLAGYGQIGNAGFGSGGGGAGLYWQSIGTDVFGNGGDGGDGLIIITFTYS
jgi:hypothetical protein